MFQAALNELDLFKLKIPYKEELKCIVEGSMDMYNRRILVLQNEVHMNKYGVEEKVKDNGIITEKS